MRVFFLVLLMLLVPRHGQAISFSPTVADMNVMPGEALTLAFTVKNTLPNALDYAASVYGVQFDAITEEPSFGPLSPAVSAWVTLDEYNFALPSAGERTLRMTVAPPADTSADSLVVGLVVRELPLLSSASVVSGASSLVFITVGSPEASARIVSFAIPMFTSTLPTDIATTIVNEGDRVVQPYGMITISNTFGGRAAAYALNPALRRIPAGQSRAYTVTWGEQAATGNFFQELWREVTDFRIGIFTAELLAAPYPGGEETLHDRVRIVVLPWRVLILVGVGSAAMMFLRKHRR